MSSNGTILALDLGVRLGFCLGSPEGGASATVSDAKILRTPHEPSNMGLATLLDWLNKLIVKDKPILVVKEKRLTFMGFERKKTSADTMDSQIKLHGIVEAMCGFHGVEFRDVARPTICKHFIGTGALKRKEGKLAVIQRARLLGYVPKSCIDDDRCDAVALWDWAAAHSADVLHLFGEEAA